MPNDVYRYTHAALSALVSPRVAHAILEAAMAAKGHDSDTVTTSAMRHLLAGRVRKELSGSLPRAGLTSTLKRLADELATNSELGAGPSAPVAEALIAEVDAEHAMISLTSERLMAQASRAAVAVASPAVAEAAVAEAAVAAAAASTALVAETASGAAVAEPPEAQYAAGALAQGAEVVTPRLAPVTVLPYAPAAGVGRLPGRNLAQLAEAGATPAKSKRSGKGAPAPAKVIARLSEEALSKALQLFGDIETVRQVIVVRRQEVVLERGHGIEAARLPGLVLSSRHLLARSGDLRAFSVERAGGVLFLFPFGEDSVVVVTNANVNIGAVLNARAALEEAA
ncbi:MAG TPA: hypothetical protein VFN07_11000 [Trueperaceae bacterium]|nr:hypothetical protein [Trueperaceae bacterium]